MFKIFLKKKLYSGPGQRKVPVPGSRAKNRRLFPRFEVDQHHLTAMNEQDILVIREISAKGFSSLVAPRAFERFTIGDVYAARMRYFGEIYDLDIKVTWKKDQVVGFELVNASTETMKFLRRLLKPIELASSLEQVDATFIREGNQGKSWFHGDNDTDLFVWKDEAGRIEAWQFQSGTDFIEWHMAKGLQSGTIKMPEPKEALRIDLRKAEPVFIYDRVLNALRRQFATDVFMAFSSELREELLATITR